MKRTSFKQKISLILFGLFLCAVLLEIGLRIGGFIILSVQEYRNQLSIRQRGEYRILCLGESTTEGQWPGPLEDFLNKKDIGIKFSVIDKGVGGTNTGVIVSLLEGNLEKYNPQMVITMMGINDSGGALPYEEIPKRKISLFFKSFRMYKLIKLLHLHIVNKAEELLIDRTAEKEEDIVETNTDLQDENNYIELGKYYRDRGEYHKALENFRKAIKINPENVNSYLAIAEYYKNIKYYDKAIKIVKKTIEMAPGNDRNYISLASCYLEKGEYNEGIEMIKKAIEINPKRAGYYIELGEHYRNIKDYNKTIESFNKAIEINPEDIRSYIALGKYYRSTKEYDKALGVFKKAVEIDPENALLNTILAISYEEKKEYRLAGQYYRKAKGQESIYYNPVTRHNYEIVNEILTKNGIRHLCVQYPMRNIEVLKRMFDEKKDIIFVDNEKVFKEAIAREGYAEYFVDMFAGDFGHCTEKGNRLLAENIANIILKNWF